VINTTGFAFPKPFHASGAVIDKGRRYSKRKASTWAAQDEHCARCPRMLPSPQAGHLHHLFGRGHGGGKRDDRAVQLLCHLCHRVAKIERRAVWTAAPTVLRGIA
jgi:hypothetical protein